jgi:hypothetical protein
MKKFFPTSESQKRFFIEWAMAPNESTYNASFVYHITGNLNRQALKQACSIFIQNHKIVHTHYNEDGSQYYYASYDIKDFFLKI